LTAQKATRTALITGLSGQDGSYLAEQLLEAGYKVWGAIRRGGSLGNARHLEGEVEVCELDLVGGDLVSLVAKVKPDHLYHLAAPSFVPVSWDQPAQTVIAVAGATASLLEGVRDHSRQTRVFLASSSAIFGREPFDSPQDEETPARPASPYGAAKFCAQAIAQALRRNFGLFVSCGILYNHESERRPEQFVTRKITRGAVRIKLGLADRLALGDLDAVRDWSYAPDVVRGMRLALEASAPRDYIFASGEGHTVREFAELAFGRLGLDPYRYLRVDARLRRGLERKPLIGNPARAERELRWQRTVDFKELVAKMVDADLAELGQSAEGDGAAGAGEQRKSQDG